MSALTPLELSLFDTIAGLPVHPLVVHAVVVVLPMAALALVVLYFVPRWRQPYGWLTMAGLVLGTGAAVMAKESGEALAIRLGRPVAHAQLASILVPVALALLVVAAVWFWLQRRAAKADSKSLASTVVGAIAAVLAVGVVGLTVLVGHSGATAVWADQIADQGNASASTSSTPSSAASSTASSAAPSRASSTTSAAVKTYTMAEVSGHASAADCWVVIDGGVYDLTQWQNLHPGGQQRILNLCGTDGTAAFSGQHGTQAEPNQTLASYKIGALG